MADAQDPILCYIPFLGNPSPTYLDVVRDVFGIEYEFSSLGVAEFMGIDVFPIKPVWREIATRCIERNLPPPESQGTLEQAYERMLRDA